MSCQLYEVDKFHVPLASPSHLGTLRNRNAVLVTSLLDSKHRYRGSTPRTDAFTKSYKVTKINIVIDGVDLNCH